MTFHLVAKQRLVLINNPPTYIHKCSFKCSTIRAFIKEIWFRQLGINDFLFMLYCSTYAYPFILVFINH